MNGGTVGSRSWRPARAITNGALAVVASLAAVLPGCAARPAPQYAAADAKGARRIASNILRADYAGSAACAACHREIHAAWERSPMHRMTRVPEGAEVRAPFDGAVFAFKGDSARLSRRDGARFVRLSSAAYGDHLYRVTRVIGGRTREDFAGVEVATEAADAPVIESHLGGHVAGAELLMPLSYLYEDGSFRLKGYSVMVGERPGLRAGGVWNQTCVFCHNTNPLFSSTWGDLHGPGAPSYQGEVVDRLLPAARRWTFEVTDEAALRAAVGKEVRFLGGAPAPDAAAGDDGRRATLRHAMRELRTRLQPRHFVELGVGCESCHAGSRAHVADPRVLPDFAPRSAFLRARPPDGWGAVSRAEWINRACARCHQVLFSRYPFTWEGERRRGGNPGGSHITSGEARDFLLGGCARQMSCVTCHDPHGQDAPAALARLGGPAGNGVCVRCHDRYAAPAALRAHAHHDPAGAGGACLNCHMPRKNMGLAWALTRYHRIGSPTEAARVEGDRPLECALCHADRSVGDLVGTMERWWGKRYDRAALRALYGELEALPLTATLARGKAHEQATAAAVLGERGVVAALPAVARLLTHPFPLVRQYARKAVEQLRGAPCAVDLDAPRADIEAAARRCVPALASGAAAGEPGAAATPPPGGFDED